MLSSQKKEIENLIERLLNDLPERSKDILEKRFGLRRDVKKFTLEAIGQLYSLTRERVRQIENSAKELISESEKFQKETKYIISKLEKIIESSGGVVPESNFLNNLSPYKDQQNHLRFLMELSDPFFKAKEKDFKDHIWYTDKNNYEGFIRSFSSLYKKIDTEELLTREEIVKRFIEELGKHASNKNLLKEEVVKDLITISKKIGSNKLDQWGLAESKKISGKSARDYVYLILNREKEPMHFKDIADAVRKQFNSNIRTASCHNELIKDDRFIIVGRGKYALKEWGKYSGEPVIKVIESILKKNKKGLTSKEIIDKVLEVKDVKRQTVLINLGNKKKFKRNKDGKYSLVK